MKPVSRKPKPAMPSHIIPLTVQCRPAAADQWCRCVNGDIPSGLSHFDVLRVRAQDKDEMFTGDLKHLKPIEKKKVKHRYKLLVGVL